MAHVSTEGTDEPRGELDDRGAHGELPLKAACPSKYKMETCVRACAQACVWGVRLIVFWQPGPSTGTPIPRNGHTVGDAEIEPR